MAWSIEAEVYEGLPGAVRLTVTGDPDAAVEIRREDGNGSHPVRNVTTLGGSGLLQIIDAEAPFRPVTYSVLSGGAVRAYSGWVAAPPFSDGRALLRSVLRPDVSWEAVTVVDETDIEYPTSTSVFPVVNSPDPVVVGDVRRRRKGTYIFATRTIADADRLVFMLKDGIPFLLRFCPDGSTLARDTLFYALAVGEARYKRDGRRLVTVDYQSVGFVAGLTDVPSAGAWAYENLRAQATAPAYANLPGVRSDYLALVLDPVTP